MNFSSWTPRERFISLVFLAIAIGLLIIGLTSGVVLFSSEFFSMLALTALMLGFALTPSFLLKPLKESLGQNPAPTLKVAFGAFCLMQLIAVALKIFGPSA
ncbi:hypothetical protein [Pseudomonas sp. LRF_L74]|uniref:hypothetical protein n=1 Tax=Pseudomonas sp. LRF_L74 TaxID=3369422 RepID=UPI003F62F4D2